MARFYRVDTARSRPLGGSGLRLAIVMYFVEAHGEALRAVSEVGTGTTFIVQLPLAASLEEYHTLAELPTSPLHVWLCRERFRRAPASLYRIADIGRIRWSAYQELHEDT